MRPVNPSAWLFLTVIMVAAAAPISATETADALAHLTRLEEQLASLAGAIPEERYAWRPAEGVRSVREVFLHVARTNYVIAGRFGAELPAGFQPRTFDQMDVDRDRVIAELRRSFVLLRRAAAEFPLDRLEERVDFFGDEVSMRWLLLLGDTHAAEHLGQAIAYARMNGVTPPWSQ